jgi:phospholipase C
MIDSFLTRAGILLALSTALLAACSGKPTADIPRYQHVFVIIEENHTFNEVIGNASAPTFTKLAKEYGVATEYYGVRHPSEPNYVALLGGDTFGIADDDAFFCKPGMQADIACAAAGRDGYVPHTLNKPSLMQQIAQAGLTWKGYFEDLPKPGSLDYIWPSPTEPVPGKPYGLYAAKHNGFLAFKSVQTDVERAKKIVGFDQLDKDIASGSLPNFAEIIPNQCNDMHGLFGPNVPPDCVATDREALIARADRSLAEITGKIMKSSAWTGKGNAAIVITFDESDLGDTGNHPSACCGFGIKDHNNPGGGWVATIVVTNHGPRGVTDATPYNHYSLLKTIEEAFGIKDYLGHAGDTDKEIVVMKPLFAVARN